MKRFLAFPVLAALAATASAQDQLCLEGCTPGYWKNHVERWDGLDGDDFTNSVTYDMSFNGVMGVGENESGLPDEATLLDAISMGGGGLRALNRHAGAAVASSDTGILYQYSTQDVIDLYRDAVGADAGPNDINSAHHALEAANEAGCPLSNDYVASDCFATEEDDDCPCSNPDPAGGCANSTGMGGRIEPSGSGSVTADDLVFSASQLPADRLVIWLMAPENNRVPFRDGLLCVSPGDQKIIRFPNQMATADGTSTLGPGIVSTACNDLVDIACIEAGSVWYFQLWFRDEMGPCGSGAGTTNAVSVSFY